MKLKYLAMVVIFGSSIILNSIVHAKQFTLQGDDSKTITLEQPPKTIAAYDLSILDTLNAIGIEAQIVPQTTYSATLAEYNDKKYKKAGTLFEPDTVQLTQLKPDLIFVGGRSRDTVKKLTPIAPTIAISPDTKHYISDLTDRSLALAKAFNKEELAKSKLMEIKNLQEKLKNKTANKTALMLFGNNDNYMVHGETDRFGYIYELSGLKSVAPATEISNTSTSRPAPGSPEALAAQKKNNDRLQAAIAANPDYIIVLDRGAVSTNEYKTKESIKKHPILSNAKAVKDKRVIFVDANAWYLVGAGLNNTAYMLNEINDKM